MYESILIIEDDLEMAQVLPEGLLQEMHPVSVAHNGAKGLEMASTESFLSDHP